MRHRCNCETHQDFAHYGGRGIRVAAVWDTYQNFLDDMGRRPEGFSLDRVNVNGNYEPSNCRWADWKTQERNRRDNKRLTFLGLTKCVSEWAEYLSLPRKKFEVHLRKAGDSIPAAIKTVEESNVWRKYQYKGRSLSVKELAKELGCSYVALKKHLQSNRYNLEKSVTWYSRKGVSH